MNRCDAAVLQTHDFLRSFPSGFQPVVEGVSNQASPVRGDIHDLILKCDGFTRDHHDIIRRLRTLFLDRLIARFLQRCLGNVVDDDDGDKASVLLSIKQYCQKNETDLRIIFDYFHQDVARVALSRRILRKWQKFLCDIVPTRWKHPAFAKYCRDEGANIIVNFAYGSTATHSEPTLPTSNEDWTRKKNYLLLGSTLVMMNWLQTWLFIGNYIHYTVVTMVFVWWMKLL